MNPVGHQLKKLVTFCEENVTVRVQNIFKLSKILLSQNVL